MSVEQSQESAALEAADEGTEFEQAFAEFSSGEQEEVTEQETPEETQEPESEAQPVAEESDYERLKRELEETRKAAQDYEHRFKSEVGRQTAYQRQIQDLKAQIQAAPNQTQAQRKQLSSRMTELMGDYPEIAEAVSDEISEAIRATRDEISSQLRPFHEREKQAAYQTQEAAVKAAYPDFEQIAGSTEFANWFANQPQSVRSLAGSRDPQEAIAVLDYFTGGARFKTTEPQGNSQVQQIKEQRQATLQRNQSVRNTAPPPVGDSADDFESAFQYFANKAKRRN